METEERISALETKLAAYDVVIGRLIAYARTTIKGRLLLRALGL
jgi:uncharacterized coiled-coil protein SlyX